MVLRRAKGAAGVVQEFQEFGAVSVLVLVESSQLLKPVSFVQVVPLSSQTEKIFPSEAKVTLRGRTSKAMADQVATVSKARLVSRSGRISRSDLRLVERALRIQLGLGDPESA